MLCADDKYTKGGARVWKEHLEISGEEDWVVENSSVGVQFYHILAASRI